MYYRRPKIQCINCGNYGHTARKCNDPVTSYGIICFKADLGGPPGFNVSYLMIQKRDSLSYVEFLRGRYDPANKDYLLRLASNMTQEERARIVSLDFNTLWTQLWVHEAPMSRKFQANFNESKAKFETLQRGVWLRTQRTPLGAAASAEAGGDQDLLFFDLHYIVQHAATTYTETEWEFPKGRRQLNECDLDCALREFEEETSMSRHQLTLLTHLKPVEEIFIGMNRVRYRHVYYIAMTHPQSVVGLDRANPHQASEVRAIRWCPLQQCLDLTRPMYIERKELLQRVHRLLQRTSLYFVPGAAALFTPPPPPSPVALVAYGQIRGTGNSKGKPTYRRTVSDPAFPIVSAQPLSDSVCSV